MEYKTIDKKVVISSTVVVVPLLVMIAVNFVYTVNMPNWDDYDSILNWLHEYLTAGSLQDKLHLLFRQHNEHRIFVDRVFALGVHALAGQVNFVALNLLGLLALLCLSIYFIALATKDSKTIFAALPVSYLLLSFSTYGLVSFAMASLQQYWQLLFSVLAVSFASKTDWKRTIIALLAAFLAAFSGAGGLLVYPAILVLQIVRKDVRRTALWLFTTGVVFWFYFLFLDYKSPASEMSKWGLLHSHPFELAWYAFAFLGNIAAAFPGGSLVPGLVGLVLCAVLLMFLVTGSGRKDDVVYAIALLMIFTAGAGALSRFPGGLDSALSSRYTIYSGVFASAIYLLYLRRVPTPRSMVIRVMATGLLSLVIYVSWISIGMHYLTNQRFRLLTSIVYPEEPRAVNILEEAAIAKTFIPSFALPTYLPVDESSKVPLVLSAGGSLTLEFSLNGQLLSRSRRLTEVGLFIGNYGGTSDGNLVIRVCDKDVCREGSTSLLGTADNAYAMVTLYGNGLEVASNDRIELIATYAGGIVPVAIWLYPRLATSDLILKTPSVPVGEGSIPKLSLDLK